MALQLINIGTIADDGTGDSLRVAFQKINANTLELTSIVGATGSVTAVPNTTVVRDSNADIYANKAFFKNLFPTMASLPSAVDRGGMIVYVVNSGAYVSNNVTWKKLPFWNSNTVVTDAVLRWDGAEFVTTDPGVKSFNSQTGDVVLTANDINTALGANVLTDAGGRISIDADGNITFGTSASLGVTGFMRLPTGTTMQRPLLPEIGMIRYNSDLDQFEGFIGPIGDEAWRAIGPLGTNSAIFTNITVTNEADIDTLTVGYSMDGPLGRYTPNTAVVTTFTGLGLATFEDTVTLTSDTICNALGTGALVISGNGGASIGGNLYVGGYLSVNEFRITGTTQSTSPTTGALTVAGGVGIGKNLNVGQNFTAVNDQIANYAIKSIKTLGVPNDGTKRGYLLLAKAYVSGLQELSYVSGDIVLGTGDDFDINRMDIYRVLSSSAYDKESFTVQVQSGQNSFFVRTVKVTYSGVVYHAIETTAAGRRPDNGILFYGSTVDSGLLYVDATYVTGITAFGSYTQFDYQGNLIVTGKIYTTGTNNSVAPSQPGSRDVKKYIDDYDYLNFDPKAGVLSEYYIPVYADFKFGLGVSGGSVFRLIDKQGFDVIFFHGNTPYGYYRPFRAYRFTSSSPWIFDAEPTSVGFLNANERLQIIYNIGTQFAYLQLVNATTGASTRTVLVKTQGSSKGGEWTFYADVTSLSTVGSPNFFLYVDKISAANDRILRLSLVDPMVLQVYNPAKTLLRSQTLVTGSSDFSGIDHGGNGRTNTYHNYTSLPWGYQPWGVCFPFTWNKYTENLIMVGVGYRYWTQASGVRGDGGFGATVSWTIPKTWLIGGTGSNVNLIQVNPATRGGKRYNLFEDDTWNSSTGGMGNTYFNAGWALGIITDEYAKTLNIGSSIHWGNTSDLYNIIWDGTVSRTTAVSSVWPAPIEYVLVKIIDSAPWSKNLYANYGFIIGNNLTMETNSVKFGAKVIAVDFLTNRFSTSLTANDTLILDAVDWTEEYSRSAFTSLGIPFSTRRFGTTVKSGGIPVHYLATPGRKLYTVTLAGSPQRRVYTDSGLTVPAMPTTISGITAVVNKDGCVWNGDTVKPVYWCTVSGTHPTVPAGLTSYTGTTTVATNMLYIAECANGVWSDIYGPFALPGITSGNNARRDATNAWDPMSGSNLLTESGKYQPAGYVIHGVDYAWMTFNTADPLNPTSFSTNWGARFGVSNGGFGTSAGWLVSYGYSTVLGYYQFAAYWSYTAASIVSSRDITGASSTVYTEAQWYAGSRYLMNVSAESATGLRVSTKPYPLFIGGYYTTTPDITLGLTANSLNYLYVKKTDTNRDSTEIFVTTDLLPIGFSQQLIAILTTDNDKVINSKYIPITTDTYTVNGVAYATSETKLSTGTALTFDGTNLTISGVLTNNYIEYTSGVKSPTPDQIKSNSIHGFNAYGSTDFPGSYYTGWTVKGATVGAQLAVSWNTEEDGTKTGVYVRANDDTGTTTEWSTWERVLTENNTTINSLTASKPVFTDANKKLTSAGVVPTDQGGTGLSGPTPFTANGIMYASSATALATGSDLTFDPSTKAMVCKGNITGYSDARLKKNIKVIDSALEKVNQLHGYTFDRIDIDNARQTGVIAQEVLQVLPEAVSENADGIYSVAYGNMVGLLIESVKELTQQVADLRAQLQAIKK